MYSVLVENRGDSKYRVVAGQYSFEMATDGRGASPVEAALAGLCGCMGHYTADYARRERIEFEGITVRAETERSKERPGFSGIKVDIGIDGARLDPSQAAELLNYVKNCPIYGAFTAETRVELSHAQSKEAVR